MDRILALREPTVPLVERMEKQRVNAHMGAFSTLQLSQEYT